MSREKQIEETAKAFYDIVKARRGKASMRDFATDLYNAGYRKASDVAREIFAELDNSLHDMAMEYTNAGHPEYFAVCEMVHHKVIRPIEKKYTEVEA